MKSSNGFPPPVVPFLKEMWSVDPEDQDAYEKYVDLIKRLEDIFTKIVLNHFIVADCMRSIVEKLYNEYQQFIKFVVSADLQDYGRAKNAVDTAVLGIAIATRINLSLSQIYRLIESALLHDVGMLCIPQEVIMKDTSLSKHEYWYILTHPFQSYKVINREFQCFEGVAQISLQHHESWNGGGYPKGLYRTEIELEARIITTVDAFTAMISNRPYRLALGGYQAMKNLLSNNMAKFDPTIVNTFVQIMGLYPIGSLVELNNGSIAWVIEHWEGSPILKPQVRVLTNPSGELCKSVETVDLLQEKRLFIKKSLNHQWFTADIS
jgi:HD-GYP domain-containing protein (c-di-GMP phosphodiesterase class II)